MNMQGIPQWLRSLALEHLYSEGHSEQCLGSLAHITPEARLRGVGAVSHGEAISLSRPVTAGASVHSGDPRESVMAQHHVQQIGITVVGSDRVELDAHGMENTHLDGLAHIGFNGQWHGGVEAATTTTAASDLFSHWAGFGITTRAVLVDLAANHEGEWFGPDEVRDKDLEDAMAQVGVRVQRGDALLMYMGRDVYEGRGNKYHTTALPPDGRPGLGQSAAEWIAEHEVSAVCWDFLDAHGPGMSPLSTHSLIWAIGLALVDNCELGAAARRMRSLNSYTGLLTIAPLMMASATGCMVNPILLI